MYDSEIWEYVGNSDDNKREKTDLKAYFVVELTMRFYEKTQNV